ncbi:MAG: cytochrome c [Rhodospirillaceae bacterium]|nr:cytochrome c [Rhodospirillaceae bacterium]
MNNDEKGSGHLSAREVDPNVPRNRTPVKMMALTLLLVIIASVIVLSKTDRRSIKAYINIPELNQTQMQGREIFNRVCAECHGVDGTGDTKIGPPLMHPYHRKEALSDERFLKVIRQGTPEDKWKYGHMPAQIDVSDEDAKKILSFFNALRAVNKMGE